MANTPGGSFIPKRNTSKTISTHSGKRIYIFSYIAYVFFFGTLFAVIGIFFLNQQADNKLQDLIVQIEDSKELIDRSQLDSVRVLDKRLSIAEQIL